MLGVQSLQQREVAELRWDGAIELIRVEFPDRTKSNDEDRPKTSILSSITIRN